MTESCARVFLFSSLLSDQPLHSQCADRQPAEAAVRHHPLPSTPRLLYPLSGLLGFIFLGLYYLASAAGLCASYGHICLEKHVSHIYAYRLVTRADLEERLAAYRGLEAAQGGRQKDTAHTPPSSVLHPLVDQVTNTLFCPSVSGYELSFASDLS